MALALYRKYRPRTFAEMIGQEQVTDPLSQALRSGRLNHAYLFSGPRGCGKTSSARILARSLNCEQGPTPEPCGQCDSCRGLAPDGGGSIDVIEIDAASHGGVDDARELREKAFFAPARSRFKIYIIDEAHMVSSAGFNALLKLVEEPPEYVKFIFATTEPEKVLGTIKSRTHHYPFRLFPPKVLRPYLEQLCEAEGVTVDPAVFPLVVRAGGGSMRDSLSVLDQLIAGAGPEGVGYARAAALLGVTDAALIDEMCDALAAGDGAAAYATVDRVAEAGHDSRRFASDLLERLRDLIVLQQVPDAAAKGLIDGPADQIERMAAQAQRLGPATLSRCADIVHNGLVEMRGTTAPRLLLELICARMLLPGVDDSSTGLLQRLERMERRLTLGGAELPPAAADSAHPTQTQGVRPAAPAPGAAAAAVHPDSAGTPAAAGAPTGAAAARAAAAAAAGARNAAPGSRPADAATNARPAPNGAATGSRPAPAGAATGSGPAAAESGPRLAPAATEATVGAGVHSDTDAGFPASAAAERAAAGPTTSGPAAARRPVPPSAVMPDPATPEPPRPGAANPGALDAVAVRRVWPEVVGKVNRSNKRIAALMRDAVVRDLDGDTLVLTVKSTVLAKMMADHAAVLTDALYEELGGRWQIRCEVAGERGASSLGGPSRPSGASRTQADTAPARSASDSAPPRPATAPSGPASDAASGRPDSGAAGTADAGYGRPASGGAGTAQAHPDSVHADASRSAAADAGPNRPGSDTGPGYPGSVHAGPGRPDSGVAGRDAAGGDPGQPATGSGSTAGSRGAGNPATGSQGAGSQAGGPAGRAGAGSPDASHRPAATPAVDQTGEEDWPEPARPGGAATGTASAPGTASAASSGDAEDWPAAARPGGDTATATAPVVVPKPAAPATAPAGGPRPAGGGAKNSAIAAARAAAAAAAAGGGPGKGPRVAQPARKTADAEWAGEPPYDPDFDGPVRGGGAPAAAPAYEGFDPGDEPLDDVIDERTARQSSEEQAVQLLRETFGAEKIDEVDAR
ncbi:DNA polymerase III subunit gamma and tau [Micromonospora sp. WMMD1076]|uniref:DNA polymerase III subunit gamma and tau n=1 Tax=Micromonospora sp. WMMD1076 TaxID=3016103 RepID=UPI00249B3E7E|nr:DNA polymerase III subunit gamma and tau [Micromonospora sp. WMMD1076]WFF07612.1 DNA polymerase III subunit gamma and tau [Micromonospora sp. WMMD1076]